MQEKERKKQQIGGRTYFNSIDLGRTSTFGVDWSRVIFAFTSASRYSLSG